MSLSLSSVRLQDGTRRSIESSSMSAKLSLPRGIDAANAFHLRGWLHIHELFNSTAGKDWTVSQLKNFWGKLRMDHKLLFELLKSIGIQYQSKIAEIKGKADTGRIKERGKNTVQERFQMVSVGTDLASIVRSHQKDNMSVDDCVSELLSSGHVEEGSPLHMFSLWFLRVKDNRNSYRAAKTPFLRLKFIEYCFEGDNQPFPRKG
ncbi:Hypothetical predicted protein [Olea europaea subsp. europaea]|uniref:Uncharacterized protein n=1 Tax=Olea europaea subsp. europaea TaxID=158383 RepID=A0A8S0Q0X6_OLEEU|nr:Hypothetical predicted protein [Olea europaea subsp. europaea]